MPSAAVSEKSHSEPTRFSLKYFRTNLICRCLHPPWHGIGQLPYPTCLASFGGAGCAYERVNEHLVPLGALTVGLANIRNLNIRTVFEAAWFVVQDS